MLNAPVLVCPRDNDGDGDCGNPRCGYCGGDGHLLGVPCGLCGEPTRMRGTRRCDRCWELERRIQGDPALARKIFEALDANT